MKLIEKWKTAIEKQKKIDEFKTIKERKLERNAYLSLAGAGLAAAIMTMIFLVVGVPLIYQMICPILVLGLPGGYSAYKINKLELEVVERYESALNN